MRLSFRFRFNSGNRFIVYPFHSSTGYEWGGDVGTTGIVRKMAQSNNDGKNPKTKTEKEGNGRGSGDTYIRYPTERTRGNEERVCFLRCRANMAYMRQSSQGQFCAMDFMSKFANPSKIFRRRSDTDPLTCSCWPSVVASPNRPASPPLRK